MPPRARIEEQEAKHGQKMIEVKVRFWTNNIAESDGKIVPRHAWTGGVVRIEKNTAHAIDPGQPIPFNSLLDVGAAIEKVLLEHQIVLHASTRMKKYIQP